MARRGIVRIIGSVEPVGSMSDQKQSVECRSIVDFYELDYFIFIYLQIAAFDFLEVHNFMYNSR